MDNTKESILRLLDAITDKLDIQTLDSLLTHARLTEYDFNVLKADLETLDLKDFSVDYILENASDLDKADIKGINACIQGCLDDNERFQQCKDYLDSLWFKSAKDKPLMLELHEMLDSEIDIAEPLRTKVYNLTDTMQSVLDELQDETPDYAKIIKWLKSDLESEATK